jgi:hypothetical protein
VISIRLESPDLLAAKSRGFVRHRSPLAGQEFEPGWSVDIKMRTNGASAGTCDVYYFNGEGKRYRSRAEVRAAAVG